MEKINIDEMDMHRKMDVIYMAHGGHVDHAGHSKHFAMADGIIYHLEGGIYIPLEGDLKTWLQGRG